MTAEDLLETVTRRSGQPISLCYQCRKCSAGCPTVGEFDYAPNVVMRMVQLGLRDELLASRAIWMCVSCETCGTRCPNGIWTSAVMDTLRAACLQAGGEPAVPVTVALHSSFVGNIRLFGRLHEATMLLVYKLRSRVMSLEDLRLALKLFLRGRIRVLPKRSENLERVRRLFKAVDRGESDE
jgi:heterodisulfide reductase subunit C